MINLYITIFLLLAKEEEKNKLLKRSEELKAERVELEAKAKQLSNAIMVRLLKGLWSAAKGQTIFFNFWE